MANRKTTFLLRRSNVIDKIPDLTGLTIGELAVNTADAKLYTLYTNGNVSATEVRQIGWDRLSTISGGTVSGNTIFTSGVTGNSFNIFSTPVNNNTNSQILTRNSTTGNVEYRDVSSISGGISGDYLPLSGGTVTGGTIFTSGITANTLQFDTTFTGTVAVGQIAWDSTFGTLQQGLVGGNVIQKIGETSFALVKNAESTTLNKGEVVYIFGATGDKISVKRASNTGDTTSSKTLGVVAENIAANQNGLVITKGTLDGLNLGAYSAGTILWLSSTPGQFTDVKQYAPYHLVFIGVVQRANAGNGQLYVSPQNGYELDELHNVVATGATYGDLLSFSSDGTNDLWVSTKTLNGSYTITGNTSIGQGLTANTISASTYQNLPTDIRVTGGTYNSSSGIITFTNNTGGTFTVTGLTTGTTLGTYLTGASYSNNVITFTTNSGTTSTVTINTMTGLTINGALSATTISANTITSKIYENLGGLRAVPLALSNAAITANSYDYYMNIRIPHSITASTVLCMYSTLGSDATRVAIYRGRDTTATLVGQGFKAGATLTTISEYTLTATTGQTLSFSGGEWIVIAVAVGGTTTVNRSATTYASTDLSWANTTDSAAGGFPTNPRAKSLTLTSFPCFEIF